MKKTSKPQSSDDFSHSLRYAINGIMSFIECERKAKIHILIVFMVIIAGSVFKISRSDWTVLIICMGLVISTEIINTSIEKLTDIVQPAFSESAGRIKDMSAGAVLITALMAVILGLIVFFPHIIK